MFVAVLMVLFAFLVDILELGLAISMVGLIINRLIVIIKWLVYTFWFYSLGVPIFKLSGKRAQRRALVLATTFIVGMIPVLGALPEFTLGILATVAMTRFEDATGVSTTAAFDARKRLKKAGRQLSRKRVVAQARKESRERASRDVININRTPNRSR